MSDTEPRRFIPGACGPEGDAAHVFKESDTKSSPASLTLAKEACRSCVQLKYCQSQREAIARVLHAKGVVAAVVGSQVVRAPKDIAYLTSRERLTLEPKFQFDTSQELPSDPHTATALLRQWARTHHRILTGKTSAISLWATTTVRDELLSENSLSHIGLAEPEVLAILHPLAKLLVAYARKDASHNTWARRPQESQLDMHTFRNVAPLYLADAEKIKALGLTQLRLALYYDAGFWHRLFSAYETSQCVTQLEVKDCCEKRPRDPIPAIEKIVERSNLRRNGQYQNPFKIPKDIRAAESSRLARELQDTHPYITLGMINKALRSSSLKAAHKKIEELTQPHIAEIAYEFKDKVNRTVLQYCLMHTEDPRESLNNYLRQTRKLTAWTNEAGYRIAPSEIEIFALRSLHDMTIGEIVAAIEAKQLRRDFAQGCKRLKSTSRVPGWVFEKIVHHHPREEWWEIASNLNQLIEMDVLQPTYLSCALEAEAADIEEFMEKAVGRKGAYITFTFEAYDRYEIQSLMNLVRVAKLDVLIYGHKLPADSSSELVPPLLLGPEEIAALHEHIRKGANAARILNGEIALPKEILIRFGWPTDPDARKKAFSAIRNSALRGRKMKRVHERALARRIENV